MQFALVGGHPDGVAFALALAATDRHQVIACTERLPDHVSRALCGPALVRDTEEVLADPQVECVIVAGPMSLRTEQLRRVLQSERHAACVHPCGEKADVAYEMAMLAADVKRVAFPLLPEGLHPAFRRLAEVAGPLRLLTSERSSPGEVLDNAGDDAFDPSVPGWDVLRAVGGEIAEVWAMCAEEALLAGRPVLLAGRFVRGGVFQAALVPGLPAAWRLVAVGERVAELTFPQGWAGPSILQWGREEEYREAWDAWAAVAGQFEAATEAAWNDEVRCLELDDAARNAVRHGRATVLDYQEANEEVGFKGTMTLVGCGIVWLMVGVLFGSVWVPWVRWLIPPLLAVFLLLQSLRYIIPPRPEAGPEGSPPPGR